MSLRQIARLAGLSPAAVSLALRGSPKISEATRRRVTRLAERAGYRPNPKLNVLMAETRASRQAGPSATLGVISFYDSPRPWEKPSFKYRIYDAMQQRADELGYRLDPVWLHAPEMTYARARLMLETRGIEGLLSFGSPNLVQELPPELSKFAIVNVGNRMKTPLHRVISHFHKDTWRTLERLHELGYRRPGLVIGRYEDGSSLHACASAYLGWCEFCVGTHCDLPIHRVDQVEPGPFLAWLKENKPDVVVFSHLWEHTAELRAAIELHRIKVPAKLGVAVVSQRVEGTGFSGMQQNQQLMGAWAVELLASLIMTRSFGLPEHPQIRMTESEWVDEGSLRDVNRRRTRAARRL